jgi:hypothetical protein
MGTGIMSPKRTPLALLNRAKSVANECRRVGVADEIQHERLTGCVALAADVTTVVLQP